MSLTTKECKKLKTFAKKQSLLISTTLEKILNLEIVNNKYSYLTLKEISQITTFYVYIEVGNYTKASDLGKTFKTSAIKNCIPLWIDKLIIWNDKL
jgi:hypothetical protein